MVLGGRRFTQHQTLPHGKERLDKVRNRPLREQPAGKVLRAHEERYRTSGIRAGRLAPVSTGDGPGPEEGLIDMPRLLRALIEWLELRARMREERRFHLDRSAADLRALGL